jgi:hypothetical protein
MRWGTPRTRFRNLPCETTIDLYHVDLLGISKAALRLDEYEPAL